MLSYIIKTLNGNPYPGPSLCSIRRHGENRRLHDSDSVTSGNFLAAKKRGVVEGIDYGATGEVKRIDVHRTPERLDNDSIVILSNLRYSSFGDVLNCNTYEVATACALVAEKLICIIDGLILDETGRLIRFLTLEDADMLMRNRAKQSEIAANYVKAIKLYVVSLFLKSLRSWVSSHQPPISPKQDAPATALSVWKARGSSSGSNLVMIETLSNSNAVVTNASVKGTGRSFRNLQFNSGPILQAIDSAFV